MHSNSHQLVWSQRSPQRLLGVSMIAFLVAAAAGAGITGPTVLAPLSGQFEAEALEISDSGRTVGFSGDFTYSYPYYNYFYVPVLWDQSGAPAALPLPASCPTPVAFLTGPSGPALSVNNRGEAVGFCLQFFFDATGIRWDKNGNPTLLAPVSGDDSTFPFQINETGTSAGYSYNSAVGNPSVKAVLWDASGTPTVLTPLPGDSVALARDVNNNGVAVGKSGLFNVAPFIETGVIWDRSGFPTALSPLPGDTQSSAWRINERGEALGVSIGAGPALTGVKWDSSGNPTALGFLPGDDDVRAQELNDRGQAAGASRVFGPNPLEGVFWDASGNPTAIPAAVGDFFSHAHGLNNSGQVAGGTFGPSGVQAAIWKVTNGKVGAASERTLTRRELRRLKKDLRKWERKNAGSMREFLKQQRNDLVGN